MKKFLYMLCIGAMVLGLSSQAEAKRATLTWNANTESDLAGYELFRERTCNVLEDARRSLIALGKDVLTYEDTTIPEDWTEVCYWAKARDLSGNKSAFSNSASKVLVTLLPAPMNLRQVNGVFTWDSVPGATGYLLRIHEAGTPYSPCESMTFCNIPKTLPGLTKTVVLKPNTEYDVWIHSHDINGVFGPSTGIKFRTALDTTPPAGPVLTIVKAVGDESVIVVIMASKVLCSDLNTIQDPLFPSNVEVMCVK